MTVIVRFKGTRVSFYKRAQILVADLWGIMEARGEGHAISIDWLTMFADYRVPQALVYLGALRYSDALMQALKNGALMQACGRLSGRPKTPVRKRVNVLCLYVGCLTGELLSSGDRREVEIRGCSIWCVELIKDRFCKLVQERDTQPCSINSAVIDFYLWPYAKQHHKEMAHIPIHHTRCIYYWQSAWQQYIQVQLWH